MIIELTSVASVVDDETFMVYPLYQNGHYDNTCGVQLKECGWFSLLNEWECKVVQHLLDIQKRKR